MTENIAALAEDSWKVWIGQTLCWWPWNSICFSWRLLSATEAKGSSLPNWFKFCGPLKISLENSVDIWNKKIFLGFGVVSSGTGHEVTVVKMPNLLDFISDHFQTSQARFSSQLSADSVHVTSKEPIRDKQFTLLSIRIRENSMMA